MADLTEIEAKILKLRMLGMSEIEEIEPGVLRYKRSDGTFGFSVSGVQREFILGADCRHLVCNEIGKRYGTLVLMDDIKVYFIDTFNKHVVEADEQVEGRIYSSGYQTVYKCRAKIYYESRLLFYDECRQQLVGIKDAYSYNKTIGIPQLFVFSADDPDGKRKDYVFGAGDGIQSYKAYMNRQLSRERRRNEDRKRGIHRFSY